MQRYYVTKVQQIFMKVSTFYDIISFFEQVFDRFFSKE